MNQNSVDIEKIMDEIRNDAASLPDEQIPSFEDLKSDEQKNLHPDPQRFTYEEILAQLINESEYLNNHCFIDYNWDTGGGVKGFIKKGIRRLFRFLFFPLIQKQNDINLHVAKCINITTTLCQINRNDRQNSASSDNGLSPLETEAGTGCGKE